MLLLSACLQKGPKFAESVAIKTSLMMAMDGDAQLVLD